jgi:hypothetical protein
MKKLFIEEREGAFDFMCRDGKVDKNTCVTRIIEI